MNPQPSLWATFKIDYLSRGANGVVDDFIKIIQNNFLAKYHRITYKRATTENEETTQSVESNYEAIHNFLDKFDIQNNPYLRFYWNKYSFISFQFTPSLLYLGLRIDSLDSLLTIDLIDVLIRNLPYCTVSGDISILTDQFNYLKREGKRFTDTIDGNITSDFRIPMNFVTILDKDKVASLKIERDIVEIGIYETKFLDNGSLLIRLVHEFDPYDVDEDYVDSYKKLYDYLSSKRIS